MIKLQQPFHNNRFYLKPLLLALWIIVMFGVVQSFSGSIQQAKLTPLTIATPKGNFTYNIELAITDKQRRRGLMFRKAMARDYGMLFDFDRTQNVAMWMKNTFLPLDMIFMRADGTIAHIVENTTPHSLSIISSRFPVRYVLELNAGEASRTGMRPGQVMNYSIFLKPGG